ncbi:hypothetical protein E3T61_18420 [Cryobacterium lactosi]|uniref:Uncharacterized protein n=1 Tax=Cryobacterium lactosi TaxID=1259202 RepID=A0A4V3IWD7_9MICO|nr:hypothetical protein [Cryobacterium lactosi]TFD84996.1 hypothetical protein E3T61_18420 [Cryobacterium lactosi]
MTTPFVEPKTVQVERRNPFELALGFGAIASVVVGLMLFVAATSAYNRNGDTGALVWAGLATQLWQLGVVVLVGMTFYWMVQWNKSSTERRPVDAASID